MSLHAWPRSDTAGDRCIDQGFFESGCIIWAEGAMRTKVFLVEDAAVRRAADFEPASKEGEAVYGGGKRHH